MPIQSQIRAGAFSPEQVRAIVAAFEGAWHALVSENSYVTGQSDSVHARDILAKRIIDQAKAGILDPAALQQDALAYLRTQMPEPEPG